MGAAAVWVLVGVSLAAVAVPVAAQRSVAADDPTQPPAPGAASAATSTVLGLTAHTGPLTAAEQSGFQRHTTYDEMLAYLRAVRATSTDMRLATYGKTHEGRDLMYAILSRPSVSQPWEAALLGKPIVLLAANVHGNERTMREALLMLTRELATSGTPQNQLLDRLTVLVAPQINPDGFHRSQHGERGNAWGIDLNRDYIKLEQPEIASYVGNVINSWHPHVILDGHNGASIPYNLTYQCPSHASLDQRITRLCDEELFPFVDRRMRDNGFKSWYFYSGTKTRWNTGSFQARFGRNYGGFANAISVLYELRESRRRQDMTTDVRSGLVAVGALLEFVWRNAKEVVSTVDQARREALTMGHSAQGDLVVKMRYGPEDRRVTYEIGQREGDEWRFIQVTSDSLMKRPIPVRTRPRPYAYLLPRDAVAAVAMLRRHNITVEMLDESTELAVQAYAIQDVQYEPQYNHVAAMRVIVGDTTAIVRAFPRGTYVVPTGQGLGRVVTHMLEPETDDNVIYWNTMDAWLPRPGAVTIGKEEAADGWPRHRGEQALVPIFKLMTPRPLPTRIISTP